MSAPNEVGLVRAGIYPIRAATFHCGEVDAIGQSPICDSAVIEVLEGGETATIRGFRDMCPNMEYIAVIEEISRHESWRIKECKPEQPPALSSIYLVAGGYSLSVHLTCNTPFVPDHVVAP